MKRSNFNLFVCLALVSLGHRLSGDSFAADTNRKLEGICRDVLPLVKERELSLTLRNGELETAQEDWLTHYPDLRHKLAKVREQFLLRRDRELLERTDIPRLSEIKFKGKIFPVVHFLGAGHGNGDGSAYVARDGNRERLFKVMKNPQKFENHKRDMAYFKRKGLPTIEVLEEDVENLCFEIEGREGLSLDILNESAIENYGLTSAEVSLIKERRTAAFELKYDTKQYNIYEGNILMDIQTGRFFLLDPH